MNSNLEIDIHKTGKLLCNGRFFKSNTCGRTILLRGVNLSGNVKQPYSPYLPSHEQSLFFDGKNVSFIGRPFPLSEADEHFARLQSWGFNFLRYNITWEALEHSGPGIYDHDYIDYVVQILLKAKQYGFRVFIDPHQDVWARFCGGSGAPLWTLECVGFNVQNFQITNAALVQNLYEDPSLFPKMIWPTNYWKLATATMFTLFFAGNTFAPKRKIDGVPIQDYLQNHYCNAIAELAKAIVKTPGLKDDVVVGYDTLNEPHYGYIGYHNLNEVVKEQEMRKGLTPTPLQTMILGEGFKQVVQVWEMSSVGPREMGEKLVDPAGKRAWKEGFNCIWAEHGVWDINSQTVLITDYFSRDPDTGAPVDFLTDFWKPFVNKYTTELRIVHENACIFVEPPVYGIPPVWEKNDAAGPICFAPHFYDGVTLLHKSWNSWFNIDYVGFLRGLYSSVAFSVKFGETAIKDSFRNQIKMLREEGETSIGMYPTVIGEIGIPYDMDGKTAYLSGDYTSQIQAMDASMCGVERDLVNYTIWNYCADNCHTWGDQWNGEDLSIWSPPVAKRLSISTPAGIPSDLNAGARALEAFVRPYPILTPGIPTKIDFNLKEKLFTCTFKHPINEDGSWDYKADGIHHPYMELFLPNIHFPNQDTTDVYVSSGVYSLLFPQQRLIWQCDCIHNSATSSANSHTALQPKNGKIGDNGFVTHKIVIRYGGGKHDKSVEQVGLENDEDGMCPQCGIM
ncbi:glycoside hydrolase superfamily [Globomyces pollinis-pini]|nr:glycoside hydrolase superfamily [Globomyces pollinis-pini]